MSISIQFITNTKGKKISAIVPIEKYKSMLEELDMQEDIKLYDEVMARNEPRISFDEYLKKRKKKV
ncbi:MAG: hypothetical protein ACKVOR_00020 [Flavobacteriales bacterium]